MTSRFAPLLRALAGVAFVSCLASCANSSPSLPEADFSTTIVGSWQGTVGEARETMSNNGDGSFICQLYSRGFIANTLSQGAAGKVSGTWQIIGAILTLKVTSAEHA